jgi:hypothetical protein
MPNLDRLVKKFLEPVNSDKPSFMLAAERIGERLPFVPRNLTSSHRTSTQLEL